MRNTTPASRRLFAVLALLPSLAASACAAAPAAAPARLGLSVDEDGVLMKGGRPYAAIGINYFGAFMDTVVSDREPRYKAGFRVLKEQNIPFVRFAATPFWPKHLALYNTDRAGYFARMDALVREAEAAGIGLVPSLFWHAAAVPDLVGEPLDQWGNPESKTHRFMQEYTRQFVTRYRNSPAVWAWEFGNEYKLPADLPNAPKFRPKVQVDLGTPAERSARDDLTGRMVVTAWTQFARAVRAIDAHRAIISGNSCPRQYGYHNFTEGSWTIDTREQFKFMLRRDSPDPMDTLCMHLYAGAQKRYFEDKAGLGELIRVAMDASAASRKPLFIGEFGADRKKWKEQERAKIEELIAAIEKHRVPLSAVWVFQLDWQEGTHNITPDNDRAYILALVGAANARIAARTTGPAADGAD